MVPLMEVAVVAGGGQPDCGAVTVGKGTAVAVCHITMAASIVAKLNTRNMLNGKEFACVRK